ncbi:MAG: universal stress protein [Chloroflexota bacterium]
MYKKILVALDGSDFSECSLEDVRTMVKDSPKTEVVLLRVLEPMPEYYMTRRIGEDFRRKATEAATADATEYLNKLTVGLKKEGITTSVAVKEGKPAEEILDFARKNQIELIVLTTHGRSGVSRLALGSVAEKVIRSSALPVLSISPPGCRIEE